MNTLQYTVVLEPNGDELGYTATVPALTGCITCGDTMEEAVENVKDAIALWISIANRKGESIPADKVIVSQVVVAN